MSKQQVLLGPKRYPCSWAALAIVLAIGGTGCCKKEEKSPAEPASSVATAAPPPAPAAAPEKKEDGSSWAGTYLRYGEAVRRNGKKIPSPTTAGKGTLTLEAGKVTYFLEYGPGLKNKITQVYTFTPENIAQVKNGYNVQLTWQSMEKIPTNANYIADKIEPVMKVRGEGDKRHIELEISDPRGTRGDVDFSVGGVDLKKAKLDEDFE